MTLNREDSNNVQIFRRSRMREREMEGVEESPIEASSSPSSKANVRFFRTDDEEEGRSPK